MCGMICVDRHRLEELSFASVSLIPKFSPEMLAIVRSSLRNNAAANVTGVLYFDGSYFFQVLEGQAGVLAETMGRIVADTRHTGVIPLVHRPIPARRFLRTGLHFVDGDRLPDLSRKFPIDALRRTDLELAERIGARLAASPG